ncbi:MAG TPA: porin [Acetobacteraceae bacterium]|nr:porin [Acetobacteraceae bacterium]
MRKFLLASAAAVGLVAGAAGSAHAQAAKPVAPGSLVVHLNGLLTYQMDAIGSSVQSYGGYKLNSINDAGFLRLYPGFDAMTNDGFEYGVASEIRDEYTNPGQGEYENGTSAAGAANNGTLSLIIRRAYAYLGSKKAGIVRIGQGDGPWTLMQDGVFENFGDGNLWNSDGGIGSLVPGAAHPTWLFSDTGALYTTLKVVYLSPSFDGVNFGIGYEPNSNSIKEGLANCNVAALTCQALASAPGGAGNARRKNTLDAMLQYTTEMNGFGVKLSGGYIVASPIGNSTGARISDGTLRGVTSYKQLEIATIGGQVSYAGFMLGANAKDGQVNNGYTFLLPGQRRAIDWLISAEYSIGPALIGGYYFNNQSAGAHQPGNGVARTEQDNGVAIGANYAVTPNFGLFITYVYGQRKQYGFDFANNTTIGTTGYSAAYDRTHSQGIGAGASLKW